MHKYFEIDFSKTNGLLNDVLFNVVKVNLVTTDMFDKPFDGIPIDNYVAVINAANKKVLSIVSNNYHLFTNKEALELGKQAFVQLFPSVKKEELVPYKVVSPSTKTFCHIDLIHQKVDFNVWEQETWLPFIRITNSYNRTFSLSFELGFVRKLCSNGVIFDKRTIKVKYNHTKGSIPVTITADVSQLKKLENEFKEHLFNLKRFHVSRKHSFPLICKALGLDWKLIPETPAYKNQLQKFNEFKGKSKELTKVYMDTEGENAFSVMNVMTDLVSHQDQYKNIPLFDMRANQFYHRISDWMSEYCLEAEKRDFKIESYLGTFSRFSDN